MVHHRPLGAAGGWAGGVQALRAFQERCRALRAPGKRRGEDDDCGVLAAFGGSFGGLGHVVQRGSPDFCGAQFWIPVCCCTYAKQQQMMFSSALRLREVGRSVVTHPVCAAVCDSSAPDVLFGRAPLTCASSPRAFLVSDECEVEKASTMRGLALPSEPPGQPNHCML